MPSRWIVIVVLAVGVLAVSSGSILVRFSQEASSITIAFFRLAIASLVLFPFYRAAPAPRTVPAAGLRWVAGVALALHFVLWFSSLRYTSVAVSLLLLYTAPVAVALLSRYWLGERVGLWSWAGIATTLVGSLLLVWSDWKVQGDWKGPVLALGGGLAYAVYLVVGRRLRKGTSLMRYVVPVYAVAALLLLVVALLGGHSLIGLSPRTYGTMFLLALFPQCLGHTSYNWALGYLPATLVSVMGLGEPVVATALAYWILGEAIGGWTLAGGGAIALGILLASREGRS